MKGLLFSKPVLALIGLFLVAAAVVLPARRVTRAGSERMGRMR